MTRENESNLPFKYRGGIIGVTTPAERDFLEEIEKIVEPDVYDEIVGSVFSKPPAERLRYMGEMIDYLRDGSKT